MYPLNNLIKKGTFSVVFGHKVLLFVLAISKGLIINRIPNNKYNISEGIILRFYINIASRPVILYSINLLFLVNF